MKLYAKTTSERATKGQGGNEYLAIKITYLDTQKEVQTLARLYVNIDKENDTVQLIDEDLDEVIKGKKL